jgi:hypothetical protein
MDGWIGGQRGGLGGRRGEEKQIMAGSDEGGTTAWTRGIYTPNRIATTGHMANCIIITPIHLQRRSRRRKTICLKS